MIRKNHEQFCKDVQEKFGNNVQMISEYHDEKTPIEIKCLHCGNVFKVLPTNYLTKWTRYCSCVKGSYFSRLKETDEYISQLNKKFGDDVVLTGKYIGYDNPTEHHCNLCGKNFEVSPKNMLRRKASCSCVKITQVIKKHTTEEFIEKARQVHGDKYDYSKVNYVNVSTKVCIICPEHGEFWQSYDSHINKGYKCPECSQQERRSSFNQFVVSSRRIYGNKYLYPKQPCLGKKHEVKIVCPEHGDFFKTPINFLLNKQGCPKCIEEEYRKKWEEKFLEDAKQIHNNKYDYSKVNYIDNHTKVCIICPEHGDFWMNPNNHLSKNQGCPECAKLNCSKGEQRIKAFLENNHFRFIHDEPCLDWLIYEKKLRPDFYLPDLNLIIEFDGEQHFFPNEQFGGEEDFKEIQKRDETKNRLCEEHNVAILRIPYWEFDNIETILKKKLITMD